MADPRGLFDLTGKIALVTGGNGGIGLAIAQALGQAGATVVIAARQEEKARTALATLAAAGVAANFEPIDVRSTESCNACVAAVAARHGRLDILVNNAGMSIRKLPQDLAESEWEEVIDINLTGTLRCARAAFPLMRDQGGGKIINLGSMFSVFAAPKVAAYASAKGGVTQLTKALATAWAEQGIQVNAILPGWVDTELTVGARAATAGLHQAVIDRTPAGRWGMPQDVAGTAVFLSAPASDFVTGTLIRVDGGFSAQG